MQSRHVLRGGVKGLMWAKAVTVVVAVLVVVLVLACRVVGGCRPRRGESSWRVVLGCSVEGENRLGCFETT